MTRREGALAAGLSLLMVLSVVAFVAPAAGSGVAIESAALGSTGAPTGPAAAGVGGAGATATTGTDAEASADVIVVDADGGTGVDATTITGGISEAEDGDTVEVRSGTYEEAVSVSKNVTLVAPNGATLDGSSLSGENDGVRVFGNADVTVEGFTITGYSLGVSIGGSGESATLVDLTLRDNVYGVHARGATTDWEIRDTTIADSDESGVTAADTTGDWRIVGSTVENNGEYGIRAIDATGDWGVVGTTVRNNGDPTDEIPQAGIIAGGSTGDWAIVDTTVTGNDAGVDAGDSSGDWTVVSSNISSNTFPSGSGEAGTGVRARNANGDWSVYDTEISDQTVGISAVAAEGDWRVRFANVTGNAVGLLATDTTGAWTVRRSAFVNNSAHGIDATGASPEGDATRNWWGQTSGPTDDQCVGNVDCGDTLEQSPDQEIDACTDISRPGSYELTSDLSSDETCIEINTSYVTVDGQGHLVEGVGSDDKTGIYANGTGGTVSDVTVTNVELSGWTGSDGEAVMFEDIDDGEISEVDVMRGDYGIRLVGSTSIDVRDNTVDRTSGGQPAVALQSGSNRNTITGNTITRAGGQSIVGGHGLLLRSSSNNTVHDNELTGSGRENVRLVRGSNDNTFTENELRDSAFQSPGLSVGTGGGSDLVLRDNVVAGSGAAGVVLSQSGEDYTIVNNTVSGNRGHGIMLKRATNGTLRANTVTGSGGHGIQLRFGGDHTAANNIVRHNDRWGINVNNVDDAVVRNNTVERHPQGGIRVKNGATNTDVRGNDIVNVHTRGTLTWPTGIKVTGADETDLKDNTIINSYRGIVVTDGSTATTLSDDTVHATGSNTRAVVLDGASGTTVERLEVAAATAPNTTLSFDGNNIRVSPATTVPANPSATGAEAAFNATSVGPDSYLNMTVRYEAGDVGSVDESSLSVWTYDGSAWSEAASTVDQGDRTVRANVTTFGTHGVFGA
jgi:parallel beta-helix repeat protein